ncbi:MAG TPA: hypothetical protein PKA70_15705 [Saprospiraceae bacterium]|nr:hypothetical protein [Saprospiraceae bacterium]
MKKLTIFIFYLLSSFSPYAQATWGAYSALIDPSSYEGKRFRLEATVRAEIENDSAAARIWARVDAKLLGTVFYENMYDRPIRHTDWKTYMIEGYIGKDAVKLAFGASFSYKGSFYFDDFKLFIEQKPGLWELVFEDSFEKADRSAWKSGIRRWEETGYGINDLFQVERSEANPYSGRHCLKVSRY